MNLEEYRTIKDYEGLYEISNFGNVRNSKTSRILKLKLNTSITHRENFSPPFFL